MLWFAKGEDPLLPKVVDAARTKDSLMGYIEEQLGTRVTPEEVKEEVKEEAKEVKEEVKEEAKEEAKEEVKEVKEEAKETQDSTNEELYSVCFSKTGLWLNFY